MVHSAIKGFMQQSLMEIKTKVTFKSEKSKLWSQNCFIKVLKKVKNIKFMLQNSKRIGFYYSITFQ